MYCICKDEEVSVDMHLWSMLSSKVGNLGRVVDGERGRMDAVEKEAGEKHQYSTPTGGKGATSVEEDLSSFFASSKKSSAGRRNAGPMVKGTIQSFFTKQSKKERAKNNCSSVVGKKIVSSDAIACISLLEDEDDDSGCATPSTNIKIRHNDAKQRSSSERVTKESTFVCQRCTFENEATLDKCAACETPRVFENAHPETIVASWPCRICTYVNLIEVSCCTMCGTANSMATKGAVDEYDCCRLNGKDFDNDEERTGSNFASIDLLTESHSTIPQSPNVSVPIISAGEHGKKIGLQPLRQVNATEILSFAVSLNSGRVALYLASSGQPLHVNFEITQVLAKHSADKLEELNRSRQVPNSTVTQSTQSISFDDGAIRQVLAAIDDDELNLPDQNSLQHKMCEEVKLFVVCYLGLKEVEKKVVKESGQAFAASSLKHSAAKLLVSTITGTSERYQGGAKERAIANIKNGCATAEDIAVADGKGCAWCAKPFLCGKGATYCSQSCVEEGRLRRGGMFASSKIRETLFALEHGKCTKVNSFDLMNCVLILS